MPSEMLDTVSSKSSERSLKIYINMTIIDQFDSDKWKFEKICM